REPLHELAAHVDRLRQQRAAAAYAELRSAVARVEPQDCGLSANDIYHVMQAWEKEPASEEQTRIVTGLGKLREQFIQLGDSPYVTAPATARVESPPREQEQLRAQKDAAYAERDQLVAAASKPLP